MNEALVELEAPGARALVAPGFEDTIAALGALDAHRWGNRFPPRRPDAASGRGAVCEVELEDGRVLVLRHHRAGGWLRSLRGGALCSPSRPFDELRTTFELAQRGAPVPTVAFAVAHRTRGAWTGGIATLRIPGALDGRVVLRTHLDPRTRHDAAAAAGRAVRAFHEAGGRHADLHLANLLVVPAAGGRAFVIDLDRGQVGPTPTAQQRARELLRLDRSLHKWRAREIPQLDRRAAQSLVTTFLEHYVGGDRLLGRALGTALRRGRWHAALHRLRYLGPPSPRA